MPPPPEDPLSGDLLEEWLQKGPKKLTIHDETDFVDPQVLKGVLESKVNQTIIMLLIFLSISNIIQLGFSKNGVLFCRLFLIV